MTVIVQNGSTHGISRSELDAMVLLFPRRWSRAVRSIALCQSATPVLRISYHPKEQSVGFHWPALAESALTKEDALAELILSLALVSERSELPRRLGKSLRSRLLAETEILRASCKSCLINRVA